MALTILSARLDCIVFCKGKVPHMNQIPESSAPISPFTRRSFLQAGAAAGAAWALSPLASSLGAEPAGDDLNVALVGAGEQGRVLMNAMLQIPGIRFKAICDIWPYSQRYASRYLQKYGHEVNTYADIDEMLAAESDLDAAIVATPDWMHGPHSIAAMKAGLHVYCEKMMSNRLADAAEMVRTAHQTGKLLQIGHQRRSNPRYIHVKEKILDEAALLGRVTHVNAQWNRGKSEPLGWPERYAIEPEVLARYGYADMHQFRNWRWFKKYGGGPVSDLGAHQIDIFNWFFNTTPTSVLASGGIDFYDGYEMPDNIMAIYEYDTPAGTARAFYQALTTSSSLGYLERFMGVNGSLSISENPKWNQVYREAHAPEWDEWAAKGLIRKDEAVAAADDAVVVDVRETAPLDAWEIPVELDKAIHQPHLENFFAAIRSGTPLTCPGEIGYQTAVTVIRINEAIAQRKALPFSPDEFVV